jgi:hypothetical protein
MIGVIAPKTRLQDGVVMPMLQLYQPLEASARRATDVAALSFAT